MAEQISEEEIAEFKEAFSLFDTAGDGYIPRDQLEIVMRDMGLQNFETELKRAFLEISFDGSGTIDYYLSLDLYSHFLESKKREEKFLEACRNFDKERSGHILVEEFRSALTHLDLGLTDADIEETIRKPVYHTGGDGRDYIMYEDAIKLMLA